MKPKWNDIAAELKEISQKGLAFAKDSFDIERYTRLQTIAVDMFAESSGIPREDILKAFQDDTGYPTPRTDCRGVVFKDNKILLVKEIEDGGWTLPGGWCDNGMTGSENAAREVWEESGYEVKVLRLMGVLDRDKHGNHPTYPYNVYKLFYECEITGGQPKPSNETSEIRFFAEDEIESLQLSEARTKHYQLKWMFDLHRNPVVHAVFD